MDKISLLNNLRAISAFNYEVLKDRLRSFSDSVIDRYRTTIREVCVREGLYRQDLLLEEECEALMDEAWNKELIQWLS